MGDSKADNKILNILAGAVVSVLLISVFCWLSTRWYSSKCEKQEIISTVFTRIDDLSQLITAIATIIAGVYLYRTYKLQEDEISQAKKDAEKRQEQHNEIVKLQKQELEVFKEQEKQRRFDKEIDDFYKYSVMNFVFQADDEILYWQMREYHAQKKGQVSPKDEYEEETKIFYLNKKFENVVKNRDLESVLLLIEHHRAYFSLANDKECKECIYIKSMKIYVALCNAIESLKKRLEKEYGLGYLNNSEKFKRLFFLTQPGLVQPKLQPYAPNAPLAAIFWAA